MENEEKDGSEYGLDRHYYTIAYVDVEQHKTGTGGNSSNARNNMGDIDFYNPRKNSSMHLSTGFGLQETLRNMQYASN
jgi:hypothetical protein